MNCIAEQQQQKHHQTNYFATICTFEKVRRKIWRENIPKITSIFHSLWTNAMLCVKRCTEKHKKCLLQHKNTNKNFVLLFCLWSFQGMRFRVELAAPSHKRILFQVLRCVYCNLNSSRNKSRGENEKLYNVVNKIALSPRNLNCDECSAQKNH